MAHRCLLQAALVCCTDKFAHYLLFMWTDLWLWHDTLIRSKFESELSMQARAMGADAALLIAAVLPNNDLAYLLKSAAKLRLQILIEVHTVAGAPPGAPAALWATTGPADPDQGAPCHGWCVCPLLRTSALQNHESPAGHDELRLRPTSNVVYGVSQPSMTLQSE